MKFSALPLFPLISITLASNMQDEFCNEETDCGLNLCCGVATAYNEDIDLGTVYVCNDYLSAEWIDPLD